MMNSFLVQLLANGVVVSSGVPVDEQGGCTGVASSFSRSDDTMEGRGKAVIGRIQIV